MAVIQRPPKEGNATTYQGKVAIGFTKILAAEVDADLDTIYAAWNGGADTVNIADDSITGAKLKAGSVGTRELQDGGVKTIDLGDLQVTTAKIADGQVTGGKIAAAPNGVGTTNLNDGAVTLAKLAPATLTMGGDVTGNYPNPVVVKSTGAFAAGQYISFKGGTPGVIKGILDCSNPGLATLEINHAFAPEDTTKSSWTLELDAAGDAARLRRRAPGAAAGAPTTLFGFSSAGDLFLTGTLAATGAVTAGGQITGRFQGGVKWDAGTPLTYGTGWQEVYLPNIVAGSTELAPAGNNYLKSPTFGGNPRCYCLVQFNGVIENNTGGGVSIQLERWNGSGWTLLSTSFCAAAGGNMLNASALWCFDAGTSVRVMMGNWTGSAQRLINMFPTFSMVYLGTVP